jgi:hypothetical protein
MPPTSNSNQPSSNQQPVNFDSSNNNAPVQSHLVNDTNKPAKSKSKKWLFIFIILALANIVTVIIPLIVLATTLQVPDLGIFLGMAIAPILSAGLIVTAINIVVIIYFLLKRHPDKTRSAVCLILLTLSILYTGWYGYSYFKDKQEIDANNTSVSEAIALINSCKVDRISRPASGLMLKDTYEIHEFKPSDFNAIKSAAQSASSVCGDIPIIE